jgi:hypothetical protein
MKQRPRPSPAASAAGFSPSEAVIVVMTVEDYSVMREREKVMQERERGLDRQQILKTPLYSDCT